MIPDLQRKCNAMEGFGRVILLLAWLGVIAGVAIGATIMVLSAAGGSPASAVGIGMAVMVGPYIVARSFHEIGNLIS